MKTLKRGLVILISVVFAVNFSHSQDAPTMFVVHTDNVKFEKIPQYEQAAKSLKDNCEKHDIKGVNWTTISVEDGRYVYVSPIEKMADLDKNPMEPLFEKMGDAAGKLFEAMDQCYDSHSNAIVHYSPELSYNPEGYSVEGKNHREYHFLYYPPKNAKAMKEAMTKVKELFKSKGIKNGYDIYHSGFGSAESYYMVSIAGKDDVAIALGGKENDELFGDDKGDTFFNVIKLTSKYDQVEGDIRPDLSYNPSN
ncbi:hypothetical protein [Psychroserpens luteolus]|uniref:hypothetical protein n=1 Tax=Psychroserpens luteolus TaxID=2855840 RepID=UPI001E4C1221|nr:hypothetical protein [Psychroserpens luteolus]MCD2258692.1 hypothetical protein [Psychroserpens luteolus]